MQVRTENRTRFSDELKLIPGWAMVLASIAFVGMQIVCNVVLARDNHAPPVWGRAALGLGAGILLAGYFLLIGYINRDAGRRGMSRMLWTAIAVLVPNALGIFLYFLLRKPFTLLCSQCGASVESGFNYCPRCSTKLHPTCPHCQREIRPGNDFCPYCGRSLKTEVPDSV
jgi:RNA polymerase subunit RPABC4/transcription elongation factor Spt4